MSQQMVQDPNDWLIGGGGKNVSFPQLNSGVTGFVWSQPEIVQAFDFDTRKPKFWDNGDPVRQMRVVLMTEERDPADPEDDGRRTLYIKGGEMQKAVGEAVIKAGAKGLEVGGKLRVAWTGNGPVKRAGMQAPKLYTAQYRRPEAQPVPVPQPPAEAQQPQPTEQPTANGGQTYDPAPF